MAVLTVQNLSKYWGAEKLFEGISFLLNEGEKIALVGRNGAGKTTLLKILMGRLEHDGGNIAIAGGARVGYLSQDPEFTAGNTLLQEAESVFAYLRRWEEQLRSLEAKMAEETDEETLHSLMDDYARITTQYEAAGGYGAPARVKSVLFGLGFTEEDLHKPVEVLSGGQKVRLGLAKLLLEEPELMLLDEPTNHLDLKAVEWLEGYFRSLKSAAILVSHDRYFLDRVITRTLEIEGGKAEIYHGNYSYYLEEKKRRTEAALAQWERQAKEAARLEQFYLKWRNTPSRKDQAQDRKKKLERLKAQMSERPQDRHRSIKLSFDIDFQSGEDVLLTKDLAIGYDRPLAKEINLFLTRGERVALVGPNGAGKTTFLKVIQGMLKPLAGEIRWGVGIQRGYFSQDLDDLDPTRTCLEEMLEIPGFTKFDAYSLLGRFLFSGEDALKVIGQCSGGERNRLILAKLMVSGANVLILDEPTNHLDLESKAVLEEALNDFPGTILFVSHDRFFVDRVATTIWEFEGGSVTEFEGNWTAYKEEKERLALLATQAAAAEVAKAEARGSTATLSPEAEKLRRSAEVEQARQNKKEQRKAEAAAKRLEAEIEQVEARRAELEEKMADPEIYRSATGRALVAEYEAVRAELERLYEEWERILASLE
jgi:ATP-binding cassette subfamily F protein 3